jgi:hypothetical protein
MIKSIGEFLVTMGFIMLWAAGLGFIAGAIFFATGCLHSDISLRSVRMQETCTSFDAAEDREVTACALPLRFEDAVAACESLGEDLLLAPVPDDTLVDIALEVGEVWYVDVPAEWRCPMMTSTGGLERGDCDQALPFACERVIW